eukprot:gene29769-48140_t
MGDGPAWCPSCAAWGGAEGWRGGHDRACARAASAAAAPANRAGVWAVVAGAIPARTPRSALPTLTQQQADDGGGGGSLCAIHAVMEELRRMQGGGGAVFVD